MCLAFARLPFSIRSGVEHEILSAQQLQRKKPEENAVGLLADSHHVVCLIEARGSRPVIEKWF